MNSKHPTYLGIFLGVLYGVVFRLLLELRIFGSLGQLVSVSFMFLVPFVIGFIRIHFECKVNQHLSYGKMILLAWLLEG